MFDDRFRRWLAPILQGPADVLVGTGVTANQVTAGGFGLAIGSAGAVAAGRPVLGIALWIAGRLLDGLDGAVARRSTVTSGLGGFLDITLDMAAYSLMVVAFAFRHPVHQLEWLLILVGYVLCITTTAVLSSILERQRAPAAGNDRSLQFTPGLAEAGETTAVYVLLALFPDWVEPIARGWVVVLGATVIQRIMLARRLLDG